MKRSELKHEALGKCSGRKIAREGCDRGPGGPVSKGKSVQAVSNAVGRTRPVNTCGSLSTLANCREKKGPWKRSKEKKKKGIRMRE